MQPHFIHRAIFHCNGYQKFLTTQKFGGIFQFNFQFLFFSQLWLIRHKMYAYYFLNIFTYMTLSILLLNPKSNNMIGFPATLTIISIVHFIFSLLSHKAYYLTIDNKFSRAKYNDEKCFKIAQPYPWYIQLPLVFLLPALIITSYFIISIFINFIFNI